MGQAAAPGMAVVVEPRRELRELVSVLLEETGYRVEQSPSIEEAMTLIAADPPDVAVLFADIPGEAIASSARAVAQRWPWVRMIIPCARNLDGAALPDSALLMHAPWNALDVLIQAERARISPRPH